MAMPHWSLSRQYMVALARPWTCSSYRLFSHSSSRHVLSFYELVPLQDNELEYLRARMTKRLLDLNVLGRIYLSVEGINAQISLPESNVEELKAFFASLQLFKNLFYNRSLESGDHSFDKLKVKIRNQIVADGLPIHAYDMSRQPTYLEPEEFHKQVLSNVLGSSSLLLDVRNSYESEIGHFQGATQIESETFREYLEKMCALVDAKAAGSAPIYMYCTGGIRCSKAGALLRSKGIEDVRMLKGGITNYGNYINASGETSLYIGKNYTFDNRMGERITDQILTHCTTCAQSSNRYTNCLVTSCNKLFIQCDACATKAKSCCSQACLDIANDPELLATHQALGSEITKKLAMIMNRKARSTPCPSS